MDRRRRGCGKVGIPRPLRDFQAQWKPCLWVSTERLFHSLSPAIPLRPAQPRPSFRVVTPYDVRPVTNAPQLIQVFAHRDRASRQRSPPARSLELEYCFSHHHRIIPVHHSLLLHREHHVQVLSPVGQKRAARVQGRNPKPPIELGHVVLPQELVRPLPCHNSMQAQLLRQPSLPGSESAFRSPSCLRRIRRNHPDVQFLQCSSHLRRPFPIHFPARPRCPKEVTGAVAVECAEDPLLLNHFPQRPQHRHRRFFLH